MIELKGKKVNHKTLGRGIITLQDEKYITVEFSAKTSKFMYPAAFEKFLTLEDDDLKTRIVDEIDAVNASIEAKKAAEAAKRAAEEKVKLDAEEKKKQRAIATRKQSAKNESGIKRVPGQALTYMVFQDETFDEEYAENYIWAPICDESGNKHHDWDRLKDVYAGDVIFHCCDTDIRAISIANDVCFDENEGRKIECDYHLLRRAICYEDYKDVITDLCTLKYAPFDAKGERKEGYLFDLDRKLAIFFLSEAANNNPSIEAVPEFSVMLNGVPTITSMEELLDNCDVLDEYIASKTDPEYSYALSLIKRGTCFLAVETGVGYRFYSSRFIGYVNNSMSKHENNDWKDGKVTNPAIANVLGTGGPVPDTTLDGIYKDYCRNLGFEPQEKGTFGVDHKFWILKNN